MRGPSSHKRARQSSSSAGAGSGKRPKVSAAAAHKGSVKPSKAAPQAAKLAKGGKGASFSYKFCVNCT